MRAKQTVNIGGENRPVHFGMSAMMRLEEMTGQSLSEFLASFDDNMKMTDLITLVYCILYGGAVYEESEFSYSKIDVARWIDQAEGDVLNEIMFVFKDSLPTAKKSTKKESPSKKK